MHTNHLQYWILVYFGKYSFSTKTDLNFRRIALGIFLSILYYISSIMLTYVSSSSSAMLLLRALLRPYFLPYTYYRGSGSNNGKKCNNIGMFFNCSCGRAIEWLKTTKKAKINMVEVFRSFLIVTHLIL